MRYLLIPIFLVLTSGLFGQKLQENLAQGDQVFLEGDYYSASLYYLQALKADSSRLKTVEKYADACRLFYNYVEAEHWYRYIIQNDPKQKLPDVQFWLALMQKSQGNYKDAEQSLVQYTSSNTGKNAAFLKRAQAEIASCKWAFLHNNDSLPIKVDHLDRNINTPYSDFGGTQWGDSLLLFSSLRLQSDLEYESLPEGLYLTNIYQSRLTPAGPAKAESISNKINFPGIHNANICFTADKKTFFFSRCPEERRPDLKCKLFMVKLRNGKWQKPIPLDDRFNIPDYTATQPSVATTNKEEILYFVSDRPGGMGGNDIWYSVIKKNKLSDPVNLGSIVNTPGEEITPFWDNKEQALYFSSDFHKGYGGYDIFRTTGTYNQWSVPINIGIPINTSYNDLYFTVNESDSSGYLTSNRPGSFFIKSQTCCNDLYKWEFNKPQKKITIARKDTSSLVDQVRKLLPLTLYFHNDIPGPGISTTSTKLNYKTTVADYYVLKEKYISAYTKGITDLEKTQAIKEMNLFFDDFVLKSLKRLEEVTQLLLQDLQKGQQIKITVKGFTSPLNTAEYNKNLAKRRISSLLNYFKEYNDGIFKHYIEKTAANGGRMEIFEEPIGEEQAPKIVSDNPNDLRNSVYSRSAAMERRIQILYYQSEDTIVETATKTVEIIKESKLEKAKPPAEANVRFIEQFFDFGEMREGGVRTHDFDFENYGPVPFRIVALEISCGCTVADWPKNEIPVGTKARIRLTFSAQKTSGEQNEKIVVKGNIPGGEKNIYIKATIK
ncbi:MAG: DUF1573 domain-containing protein [Bacteroidota bacterium]